MKIFRCQHIPTGDYNGRGYCAETFPTASSPSVHAKQLIAAGWSIVTGYPKNVAHVDSLAGIAPRFVLCPSHRVIATSRMPAKRESGP